MSEQPPKAPMETGMVTDKQAAELRRDMPGCGCGRCHLLADRDRWIALAELVVRNWDYGPIGKAPSDEARKLLKEAHGA